MEHTIKSFGLIYSCLVLFLTPQLLLAAERESEALPRFELGVAGVGLNVAAYPASSVSSQRYFGVPWFVYRSDKVQVKEGGVKLIAYQSDKLTIDLGIGGSVNADTSITPLRDGMPDIDYILEIGPRANVPLLDSKGASVRNRLNWVTAYRFAVSTDFKRADFRGPVLNTQLRYRKDGLLNDRLSFDASVGSTWLGNQMMDYFYSVDSEFETAQRPQFKAQGGFLGVDFSASVSYQLTAAASIFISTGITSLNSSKNEDSPLFEEDLNIRVIAGFAWKLYNSKETVRVAEE